MAVMDWMLLVLYKKRCMSPSLLSRQTKLHHQFSSAMKSKIEATALALLLLALTFRE
jgi:hypothetical protein